MYGCRRPCTHANGRRGRRGPFCVSPYLRWSSAQRLELRRLRRCAVTSEKPMPVKSRPTPIVQRRSKPVNGSVVAFFSAVVAVGPVFVVGSLLVVSGAVVLLGVLLSFDGD